MRVDVASDYEAIHGHAYEKTVAEPITTKVVRAKPKTTQAEPEAEAETKEA